MFKLFIKDPELNIYFMLSTLLFLVMGLADDKGLLQANHKLILQTMAVILLLMGTDIRINNLFDLWMVDDNTAYFFTLFFIISITNAYNLIDGIDGLAASMGILIFSICGILLAFSGDHFYYTLSFSMTGVLAGYLRFNFSRKKKMLMGDTGSMLLGFLTSIILLRSFNHLLPYGTGSLAFIDPWSVFILVAYPLFDMTRVFFSRLMKGASPFRADRLHLHHLLIDRFGFSHARATVILTLTTLILSVITFLFSGLFSPKGFLIYYLILFGLFVLITHQIRSGRPV